ncbi:PTS system, beta-glucoside-specific IIA component [Enterococcus sp. AZ194]|uniref:beta-glucoside-specific PTS transporter subunit IIABC n=1 Tax=Enterococcus sp. AZ194 TaxID=2774629 RepID=UPI003F273EC8
MAKIRDYSKLANDILQIIGEEHIVNATRCATRLRLVLKDAPEEAKDKISQLPGVISVVINNGQFQIVIGQHVGEVYDELAKLINIENVEEDDVPKGNIMNRIIATMSAVFAPFVYILAAAGILQGSLILINLAYPGFSETSTYSVFSFISWAPFTFLPIFIAITASKHFRVNTYIAVACAMALVSPDWANMASQIADGANLTFLGLPLSQTTYTSSVLPPLILVWLLSYLEKFLNKHLNEVIRPLFAPLFSMIIMVPVTILILGPISTIAANGIANGYNWLVSVAPPLAGAVIGGFWQVFVIFGVHWGITPVVMANFDMYGRDSFQALQTIAVVAQVGAVLGVFLKTKQKELKSVSLSAFITGIFGITEPAIYGVTLRFKRPFIYGCLSGAVGAVVASFFQPFYFAYAGLPSLLTTVNGISSEVPTSFIGIIIGCAIAIVGPVLLTHFLGFGETEELANEHIMTTDQQTADTNLSETTTSTVTELEILAPMEGEIIPLQEIPDEVFASGAMGAGVGLVPSGNQVVAPFDGTVVTVIDSKHAIGLVSDEGVELLIHVGMDTVTLAGKPFVCHVNQNDKVKRGDLLLEVDFEQIEAANLPTITPIIITNSFNYKDIQPILTKNATLTDPILNIKN